MTIDDVRSTWMGRLVRGTTQALDIPPSCQVESVRESRDPATGTHYVAWCGEHIIEKTPARLHRRLAALAQPVRPHGRLSFGRYEVLP